ncbi:hypothetical protein GGE24_002753 [Bradyrhizobium centrosematis]|nr:hypothetical protein [Bradyrhizobium centrosematis]MCS3773441.1 hypothetical protein [Bradyrhizobium centrosematis]
MASPSEGIVAYRSMGEEFGFFAEASGFFGKAHFKGYGLLKTSALLHGTTSGPNRGGLNFRFSSPQFPKVKNPNQATA